MQASYIKWYLTGGAANTDPKESMGGDKNTTTGLISSPYAVFDNVSAVENAAAIVDEYRCIVMKNGHATESITNLKAKIRASSNLPQMVQCAWEVTDTDEDGDEESWQTKRTTESTAPTPGANLSSWSAAAGSSTGSEVVPRYNSVDDPGRIVPAGGYIRLWLLRRMGGGTDAANVKQATVTITGDYYTP